MRAGLDGVWESLRAAVVVGCGIGSAAGAGGGAHPISALPPTVSADAYTVLPASLDSGALHAMFTLEQIVILERLNRADREHLPSLNEIVLPRRWQYGPLAYSPLSASSVWAGGYAKALIVDLRSQVFGAYEHGVLARWGPVSTGRDGFETPPDIFHLNWKSPGRRSTVNRRWFLKWYFNFQNARGLSIHEYALPGRPASHACIRMLERDARWVFEWGEEWVLDASARNVVSAGTPLWIVGNYDFDAPPPWRSIDWLSRGSMLPDAPPVGQGSDTSKGCLLCTGP